MNNYIDLQLLLSENEDVSIIEQSKLKFPRAAQNLRPDKTSGSICFLNVRTHTRIHKPSLKKCEL